MADLISYMGRPGPAISLKKNTTHGYAQANVPIIYPMEKEFSISSQQILQQPIKKMFEYIQEAIIGVSGSMGGTGLAAGARASLELSNMTGIQIASRGYYAQAWAGSQPSAFSLEIKSAIVCLHYNDL